MIESLNSARVNASLPRTETAQVARAGISSVQQVKPVIPVSESVHTYTDMALGTRVVEVLNPATGIVISQFPTEATLHARKSEGEALVRNTRPPPEPVAVGTPPIQNPGESFGQFFEALEAKRVGEHEILRQTHILSAALQTSSQLGQSSVHLLSEFV